MWSDNAAEIRGTHAFSQELARLFTNELASSEKQEDTAKGAIYKALH